ncbi:hypothetical protein PE067_08300 [Paracoccus sp. DMF-8]|uniref:hypothetical protein n=1 Tax=Paracoccus sp. DMF-8 TaxID=3019445 RepID=UPI0023E76426|nr:hypothetical protein [Paracoccus sp. DMF-8]MDF3606128.1 hypothetical protein [Paracoccus sp. DMF-8]
MNLQGKITLSHDGRSYGLTINYAALCTFEEETGKNGFAMLNLLAAGGLQAGLVSARDLRALIFGGLKTHDADVTIELAGEILDSNPDALVRALQSSLPQDGDVPKEGGGEGKRRRPKRRRAK